MRLSFLTEHKKKRSYLGLLASILVFLLVLCAFSFSVTRLTRQSETEKETRLINSLNEACVQTYAVEGHYPESLDEILETYHISYDTEDYIVDYDTFGANVLPQITVIPRKGGGAS